MTSHENYVFRSSYAVCLRLAFSENDQDVLLGNKAYILLSNCTVLILHVDYQEGYKPVTRIYILEMNFYLKPSEIRYSQDSICCYFSEPCKKRIGETLDELCEGRISVGDIRPISVAKNNNVWVTWDNRRLWVFRHLERLGKCTRIPVRQKSNIPDTRMTTTCGGNNVDVRGKPGGYWYKQSTPPSSRSASASIRYASPPSRNASPIYRNAPTPSRTEPLPSRTESNCHGRSLPLSDNSSSVLDTLWTVAGLCVGALLVIAAVKR